jgi:hypothetical protein
MSESVASFCKAPIRSLSGLLAFDWTDAHQGFVQGRLEITKHHLAPTGYLHAGNRQRHPRGPLHKRSVRNADWPQAAGFPFDMSHSYTAPIIASVGANICAAVIAATVLKLPAQANEEGGLA